MTTTAMNRDQARFNMIEQQIRPWNVLDTEVLQHLALLRRDDFAPAAHRDLAFADVEIPLLPDACPGQSMLPPRLEARIFQELALRNTDTVLEVGSGSGYMAALLATLLRAGRPRHLTTPSCSRVRPHACRRRCYAS